MKHGFFSLRRLRWKLTFSYTLVTVVALLGVELFVVVAVIAFLSSPVLPYLVAQDMRDLVAPRMQPALSQTPPDAQRVKEEVEFFANYENGRVTGEKSAQGGGSLDLTLGPDDGYLLVVDDERRLLATSRELEGISEGERFDAGRFAGLNVLLAKALDGENDPWKLSGYGQGERQMLAVAPVKDDGRALGAVVATFRLPDISGPLFTAVAVSAVALTIPAAFLGTIFGFLTAWGLTRRLQRLARAAQAWGRGDFSVVPKDRSRDELGQLSRELNSMAAQLENLIQTRQELATLEARNRFARDLHDSVKQQVFATSLQVAAARALIERDTEAAESHLARADDLVRQAQGELNVLIHEMRPAALEDKGLAAALRDYATDWSQRSEIPLEVRVRGEREVPLEAEQALFRVAQEALANVAKHSGAKHAEIDLIYSASALTLSVVDDGRGFSPGENPGEGFGLQSMRERLVRLGGHVNVESEPGRGTRVVCVCPLSGAGKGGKA